MKSHKYCIEVALLLILLTGCGGSSEDEVDATMAATEATTTVVEDDLVASTTTASTTSSIALPSSSELTSTSTAAPTTTTTTTEAAAVSAPAECTGRFEHPATEADFQGPIFCHDDYYVAVAGYGAGTLVFTLHVADPDGQSRYLEDVLPEYEPVVPTLFAANAPLELAQMACVSQFESSDSEVIVDGRIYASLQSYHCDLDPSSEPVTPTTTAPPSSTGRFPSGAYCIVGVASDDVLNLRSGAGVQNGIVWEIPYNSCDVVVRENPATQPVGQSTWIEVEFVDHDNVQAGWVNARFIEFFTADRDWR